MKITESVQITRYDNGAVLKTIDTVIAEYHLLLSVNGVAAAVIPCTPSSLRELVIGFLFCRGIIHTLEDVKEILIDEINCAANALLITGAPKSGSGGARPQLNEFSVPVGRVLEQANLFYRNSALFNATGAIHGSCLCDEADMLYIEEDISRHNAVDKVIGRALSEGAAFGGAFIITSGRAPSDMIEKIICCGIPILISRGAPTGTAVAMAKEHDVTLAGFVRGGRMNIYSGERRILF